ncbi:MAG: hypothetical protein ACI4PE_04580 [Bacilli bacterium]
MSTTKKINILLACIALLFSLLVIQETFAKYLTDADGEADMNIARWKILVNNKDIRNNSDISQTLTPTFLENEHIAQNIIAPTSEGYFDIIIDHTAADVSFNYKITSSPNTNSSVSDIVTTGYSINGGEIIPLTEENNLISNDALYSSTNTNKIIEIRIYIKWDDSETNKMNNEEDTNATKNSTPAKLDVNLAFKQIAETPSS